MGKDKEGSIDERRRLKSIRESMIQRCENPNRPHYKNYGGRGITICEEWRNDKESFIKWALANGYRNDLTLDRIDTNGNYEPSNCRWADLKTQANNTNKNVFIEVDNITKTVAQWGEYLNISKYTIHEWVNKHGKEYAIKRISDVIKYGKGYIQCSICGKYYKGKLNGTKNSYCPDCRPLALKEYYKEYDKKRSGRKRNKRLENENGQGKQLQDCI